MNKIKHEQMLKQMRVNKIALSHIQNVRHLTSKNKFGQKEDRRNIVDKFGQQNGQQKGDQNNKNCRSVLLNNLENISSLKSGNLLALKCENMENVHPLSHLLDSRFQKNSVLPPLITGKNKKQLKQLVVSTEMDGIKQEESSIYRFNTSKIIISPRAFLVKTMKQNQVSRFKILRESTLFGNKLFMILQGERAVKIGCERLFKIFGSKVSFRIDQSCYRRQREEELAVVRPEIGVVESCFDGSIFNVYQTSFNNQSNELVATIEYFKDIAERGGPRRVRIYYKDKRRDIVSLNAAEQNLKIFHIKNPSDQTVQCLETLIPIYNKQSNSYSVCLKGKYRSSPSLHNIVFVDKESRALLKFYKVVEREYYLQCFGPISSFIGCAYAYSSFVWKWVSQ